MRYLNRFTIKQRILTVAFLAVMFYAGFSGYAIYGMNQINGLVSLIYEHPLTVSNSAASEKADVLEIQSNMEMAMIFNDKYNNQLFLSKIKSKQEEIYASEDIIRQQILGNEGKELEKEARALIENWKLIQDQYFSLLAKGDIEGAKGYFEQTESNYVDRINLKLTEIQNYAKNRAAGFQAEANVRQDTHEKTLISITILISILLMVIFVVVVNSIQASIKNLKRAMSETVYSNKFVMVDLSGDNEINDMSRDYNKLITTLDKQITFKDGQNKLAEKLSGSLTTKELADKAITFLARYFQAGSSAFYVFKPQEEYLDLVASYAYTERDGMVNRFKLGEGIVGQVALEKRPILLKNIKRTEMLITTGTINEAPLNTYSFPLLHENQLCGVIEISSFEPFDQLRQEFLNESSKIIATALFTVIQVERIKELLQKSQLQAEELQTQQEELKQNNEELEAQTKALRESEMKMQTQQEELRQANIGLEEQTKILRLSEEKLQVQQEELRVSNEELEDKARILEEQKAEIAKKAKELESANKFKSEFLANMSHELRTPLNSIIVLSQILADKKDNSPLTEKQMEFARTIYSSGKDLLGLINDVLDLSKVESGKLDILFENVVLKNVLESLDNQFRQIAVNKELEFITYIEEDVPEIIVTDGHRLEQILKNLLSNAFKFTNKGKIELSISMAKGEKDPSPSMIKISVSDTGIGIAKDKHKIIFDAFQQVNGTISRKYGGTGLGLSISLDLVNKLGGKINVSSQEESGSVFTVFIPEAPILEHANRDNAETELIVSESIHKEVTLGDKPIIPTIKNEDLRKMLIVSDEREMDKFNECFLEKDVNLVFAHEGKEALKCLKNSSYDVLILDTDIGDMCVVEFLSNMDKDRLKETQIIIHADKEILQNKLDELKRYTDSIVIKGSRSIDRLIAEATLFLHGINKGNKYAGKISTITNNHKETMLIGKKIMIVDDDMRNVFAISSLLEEKGMELIVSRNGRESIEKLKHNQDIDLILMDVMMPEMDGYTAMREIRKEDIYKKLPIIALTAKAMLEDKNKCIEAGANDYLTKPVEANKLISLLKVWLYK